MTDEQEISRAEHMDLMRENEVARKAALSFTVSTDQALRWMENAMRNWSQVRSFSPDQLEDVRVALERFGRTALCNAWFDAAVIRDAVS